MAKYEPELLHTFQGIFDELWQELEPRIEKGDGDEQRSELARLIVLAHRRGVESQKIKVVVRAEIMASPHWRKA
jgi:hypothetical protein